MQLRRTQTTRECVLVMPASTLHLCSQGPSDYRCPPANAVSPASSGQSQPLRQERGERAGMDPGRRGLVEVSEGLIPSQKLLEDRAELRVQAALSPLPTSPQPRRLDQPVGLRTPTAPPEQLRLLLEPQAALTTGFTSASAIDSAAPEKGPGSSSHRQR